jgi:dTDP-4-amino-4,6-dideoxygalactose transaminase
VTVPFRGPEAQHRPLREEILTARTGICPSSRRGPGAGSLASAEANAARLLSLPVFPETTGHQAAQVAAALRSTVGKTEWERT